MIALGAVGRARRIVVVGPVHDELNVELVGQDVQVGVGREDVVVVVGVLDILAEGVAPDEFVEGVGAGVGGGDDDVLERVRAHVGPVRLVGDHPLAAGNGRRVLVGFRFG